MLYLFSPCAHFLLKLWERKKEERRKERLTRIYNFLAQTDSLETLNFPHSLPHCIFFVSSVTRACNRIRARDASDAPLFAPLLPRRRARRRYTFTNTSADTLRAERRDLTSAFYVKLIVSMPCAF